MSVARGGEAVPTADGMFHRADTWDAVARDYEALAEPFTRQYAEAALAIAGGVAPGERVLDVAAGTGALALAAARAGGRVLATDLSPVMVARLGERFASEGFDRSGCEARAMDGQALDLPDGAFDAAFSIFGVMLFPDHRRGLAEMARVLRPGGRAVVAAWAHEEGAGPALVLGEAVRAVFPDLDPPPMPPGIARLARPGHLAEDMRAAGLREVAVRTVTGTWTAPSSAWVAENADRLYRFSPLYAGLEAPGRDRVRGALGERLRRRHGDGPVEIASAAHVAVGRR